MHTEKNKSETHNLHTQYICDIIIATLMLIAVESLTASMTLLVTHIAHKVIWFAIALGASFGVTFIAQYIEVIHTIRTQYRIDYMSALREEETHNADT